MDNLKNYPPSTAGMHPHAWDKHQDAANIILRKMILEALRIILGSVFVLFLPGYIWSFVFFITY